MKKIKLSLACLFISLLLVSCGSKSNEASTSESATQDPKAFYHEVDLHVENCITSYNIYKEAISSENKNEISSTFDAMIKSFDTEKKQIATVDISTGGEDQALSKNLKDAASKYIDVFVEGGKKELLEIKDHALKGRASFEDTKRMDTQSAFAEKTGAAKSPYIKLKKEFRAKYNFKSH
jgi:hypothetical protein